MHTQNRDWENELLQEVSQHYAQAEATLLDFLRIPSVQETASPDAPFGDPVRQALSQMAAWAKELGLQVNQTSHYLTIDLGDGAARRPSVFWLMPTWCRLARAGILRLPASW